MSNKWVRGTLLVDPTKVSPKTDNDYFVILVSISSDKTPIFESTETTYGSSP